MRHQVPGNFYTFINKVNGEKDTVRLPLSLGESNSEVLWEKHSRGGVWRHRRFKNFRLRDGRAIKKQIPGESYTFIARQTGETETGILPSKYGESNDFARWHKHPKNKNGGHWESKKAHRDQESRRQKGEGNQGLLGRMMMTARSLRSSSKAAGYAAPIATPEQMVEMWVKQEGKCAACKGFLNLLGTRESRGACYGHDHKTGEPHGFLHEQCNMAEGNLLRMSDDEFKNYVSWITETHNRK